MNRLKLSIRERIQLYLWGKSQGLDILGCYNVFASHFSLSADEIKAIQRNKLQALLIHAYNTVPFYQELVNDFSNNLNDWPILERRDISQKLISNSYKENELFKSSSSGTTGTPVTYYKDKKAREADIAAGLVLVKYTGINLTSPSAHIWGNASSIKRWSRWQSRLKQKYLNQYNFPADRVSKFPESLLKLIHSKGISYIDGYASSIAEFARYLVNEGIPLTQIEKVITTAEGLSFMDKDLISSSIAPVADLYGCGEINGIAIKLPNSDYFSVLDTHVIVEFIETNIENIYSILVTNLDCFGFPLIRYRVGDLCTVHDKKTQSDNNFSVFWSLEGRESDLIVLDDKTVLNPIILFGGTAFRAIENVLRHKVQYKDNNLLFLFELNDTSTLIEEKLKEKILEILRDYPKLKWEMEIVDSIPISNSGKIKYFERL
jgi:phenylacetate-CoA ligase